MTVTRRGDPVEIAGIFPKIGETLKNINFTNKDLVEVSLANFSGKRKILNIFPSIDTPTCATSVRTFNQKAASLNNAVVLCISADLPFAQGRFCGAEGIENVLTLSTFRNKDSHKILGVDIQSLPMSGLMSRAVIVVDEDNKVLHAELVAEIANEPNYDAALAVL